VIRIHDLAADDLRVNNRLVYLSADRGDPLLIFVVALLSLLTLTATIALLQETHQTNHVRQTLSLEDHAKPARRMSAMRGISDARPGFRVNFFITKISYTYTMNYLH
jgi:hypothetical protein